MKTKLLYILIINLLLIYSCKRGDPCAGMDISDKVYTYNIPDSIKSQIPYTGKDTLVFMSNLGDTVILVGSGKNSQYGYSEKNINPNPDPDCPKYEKKYFENFWIEFSNNKKAFSSINYNVYLPTPNDIESTPNSTNLEIKEYVNLDINRVMAHTTFEQMHSKTAPDDSILMRGSYQKGYYIDANKNVLYSLDKGLLKYKDINLVSWTKIK